MQSHLTTFVRVLLLTFLLSSGTQLFAQDDPFGGQEEDPFGAGADADPGETPAGDATAEATKNIELEDSLSDAARLVWLTIQASNPTTPSELARAVEMLMDVQLYPQAKTYLGRLVNAASEDKELFALQQAMGTEFFYELHASEQMLPEGRRFAKTIFESVKRSAFQPERLTELVKELSNSNISLRSDAFVQLRRLGAPATAAMVNVFADESRNKEFAFVREGLSKLTENSIEPLIAGARSNNLQVQVESVRALGNYRTPDAYDALIRAYVSSEYPESIRRLALNSIMDQPGFMADPNLAENRLYGNAMDLLTGRKKLVGAPNGIIPIWRWDDAEKKIVSFEATRATAARIAAADRAEDLYRINSGSTRNRHFYLLTQLESAKRIAGPRGKIDFLNMARSFGGLNVSDAGVVLEQALKMDLMPAAVGACEMISALASQTQISGVDPNNASFAGQTNSLVKAMLSGNRHLQFAAFEAITKLDPKFAFQGSSYMTGLAVYFANSKAQPMAVVGNRFVGPAQTYATSLNPSGLFGQIANSSREVFRLATSEPDVDVILLSDNLQRPDIIELTQQIRNDWRTKRIPIGIIVSDETAYRRVGRSLRKVKDIMVFPYSNNTDLVASHVRQLKELNDPWSVSLDDRRRHAFVAIDWLAKVASDRQTYRFYDLGCHQKTLATFIFAPGMAQPATRILEGLGTPLAQRTMVDFASQSGIPMEDREAAAAGFAASVKKSGKLLTTDQIKLQYDRYNASEADTPSVQKVLGSILDVIEAR